jgi:hypothetical protein
VTSIAATLVAALLGAGPPSAPSPATTPDGGAPKNPDAEVIENLELLEQLDLLDNLDLVEPKRGDGKEADKGDAPPNRAPPR